MHNRQRISSRWSAALAAACLAVLLSVAGAHAAGTQAAHREHEHGNGQLRDRSRQPLSASNIVRLRRLSF